MSKTTTWPGVLGRLVAVVVMVAASVLVSVGTAHAFDPQLMLKLVNDERARHGIAKVTIDSRLSTVAQVQSIALDVAPGPRSGTQSIGADVTAVGLPPVVVSENLAEGYADDAAAVEAWMNSPAQRANTLHPGAKHLGYGQAGDAWVVGFSGLLGS